MVKYLLCDNHDDYLKLFDKLNSIYEFTKIVAYNKVKNYIVVDTDNRGIKKFSPFKEISKILDEKEFCLVKIK